MDPTLGLLKHILCPRGDACTTYRCMFRHAGDEEKWPLNPAGAQAPQPPKLAQAQTDGANAGHTASGNEAANRQRLGAPAAAMDAESSYGDGPRKRIKLDNDEYDPSSPSLLPESNKESCAKRRIPAKATSSALGLAADASIRQKPISPPLLKRKVAESAAQHSPSPSLSRRPEPVSKSALPEASRARHPVPARPSSSVASSSSSSKAAQQSSSASSKATVSASSKAKPAARKAEALNPRHLGSAPAKYEIRYKLLKMLHAEFTRLNNELRSKGSAEEKKQLTMSDQDLIWAALDTEENFAITKPSIYSNTIKNRIMAYRRMALPQWIKERVEAREKEAQRLQRADKQQATNQTQEQSAAKDRASSPKQPPNAVLDTGLTPKEELAFLRANLITPIDGLANHGYVPVVPSEADIQKAREAVEMSKGWEMCERCSTRFQVFPGRREQDGALTSGGTCTHHPGKTFFPPKSAVSGGSFGVNAKRYRCCGQAVGDSAGCVTTSSHVFKTSDPKRLAMLWNFAETPPNPNAPADRAVCFDCEMGYTVHGMELIRLTATSWPGGEELLDILVRPLGEIIDLNSRYSGVWPEDIANARPFSASTIFGKHKTHTDDSSSNNNNDSKKERRRLQMVSSPVVARDLLFALISPETPLIGHGLENDLNSMRIVHPIISDTILLFPHPKGLPVRYGLKMLVERHLNRQIQVEPENGVLTGHDSAEDARAAGDLVRFKIKQQWATKRSDGWAFVDGVLVAPGARRDKPKGQLTEAFIENKI